MLNFVLTFAVFVIPVYMLVSVIRGYITATGTTWERLVAAFRGSASIFWARLNALSLAAIGVVGELSSLAGAPGVKEAIQPYLAPEYMTAYMLFVLIGAEIARRRTLAS
jgi:hypothetical protein